MRIYPLMFGLYVLLSFATLVLAAAVSRGGGRQLWLALVLLGWTVSQFNTLIEAVAFSVMPLPHALIQLAISAVIIGAMVALALALTGKWHARSAPKVNLDGSLRTLAMIVAAYEILYWTAGTFVWPYVANFYADKQLPSTGAVFALQIPRALILVAAAWPWLRTAPRKAPLVLGITYSMLGGVAPLLPENPYMAADVRLAHGIETGTSNFVFGLIVAWLLMHRPHTGRGHPEDATA